MGTKMISMTAERSSEFETRAQNSEGFTEEYENLKRQFFFLNELVSLLFNSTTPDEMMSKIVEGIHGKLGIDRVAILQISGKGDTLACTHAAGLGNDTKEKFRIQIDEWKGFFLDLAVSKNAFPQGERAEDFKRLVYRALAEQEKDSLIFPLFSYRGTGCFQNRKSDPVRWLEGESLRMKHTSSGEDFSIGEECIGCRFFPIKGIVWMDNAACGRRFDHELVTLSTLSLNMNAAIENRILITELREASIKDGLTGAFNRAYLYSAIEKEVERAIREGSHLAVAMVDLDDFKYINDTYGHKFGDRYLQEFSRFMMRSIRKMDHFCRYGGDEFVILFPSATAAQAAQIIQRLVDRRKLEETDTTRIQVSAGIASFPESTREALEILEFADRALYAAKRKGKGQIEIFHAL